MSERDDAAKRLVLARRARFVAAAVAGIAVGCGKEPAPQPCLEVTASDDAAAPQPCLSPPPRPCLAGTAPQPCLTIAPPAPDAGPPPRPCLSIAPTKRDAGGKACDPPYTIDADGKKRFKPECID